MSFVPLPPLLLANGLMDWTLTIACVVMGALGVLILLISLGFFFQTLWLLSCGSRVIASVVGYRSEEEEFKFHDRDPLGHTRTESVFVAFQKPVFTFDDENGQTHEVEGMGTMKKRFQKGDQVVLIYLPGNPKRCVVDDFVNKWVIPLSVFFVGLILSILPAYMLLFTSLAD